MEKDEYSIDDILSELKERREKEANLNGKSEDFTLPDAERNENAEEAQDGGENQQEEAFNIMEYSAEAPDDEKNDAVTDSENSHAEEPDADEKEQEPAEENDGNMVNLLELSEKEEQPQEDEDKKDEKKSKKSRKTLKAIIAALVVLIVAAIVFAVLYANNALKNITNTDPEQSIVTESQWTGMDKLVENFEPIQETEATQIGSLQDMIQTWYYNGVPCSSSHVLNVLLIGEDTRGEEILDDDTRADAAIIASVNIDTKKITLTSILRDTYSYWETEKGNEQTGQFGKINGAMSTGDINSYINCVESLYKIDIDNYVIVNFDSFESIIDTLGGVTLELTDAEINEINNHKKRYGDVTIEKTYEGTSGKVKLNGKQALAYCRIRKLDSDNMRADRQKTCLIEVFNQVQDASTVQLLKVVNTLIPYVKTGFSKNDIIKIAKYAFAQGWLDYDTQMNTIPAARINEKGAGGIYYGAWCWKSDFPQDAYNLQMLLYGKSSITLAQTRVDVINCEETGFYKDTGSCVSSTLYNEHYGELTTLESTTKEEETTKKEQ
ncbi:MAG: LCP family protein [Eubacterium sp.]